MQSSSVTVEIGDSAMSQFKEFTRCPGSPGKDDDQSKRVLTTMEAL